MSKQETNHLLKIKKKDYPQIFDFLENVPKGTKTAHIREALIRYINDLGGTPPIPFNNKINDMESIKYDNGKLLRNPSEERKKEIREAIKQENIKQSRKKSNEEDELEELVDLDVNQL
ncbi:plasmid segregation protein ParR (plasmid) [Staphylococcus pseudoxylosus]|uniref:plasmid segregation protein ParR n=1 Tax=Staphylococcus TaxID=1279 RepID=UPI001F540A96|nr:plasmid segregation protein ParR [Staphylococcus succinus]MEB7463567.1 plasmid segregation protein ParR [Staphylococcus succinus]